MVRGDDDDGLPRVRSHNDGPVFFGGAAGGEEDRRDQGGEDEEAHGGVLGLVSNKRTSRGPVCSVTAVLWTPVHDINSSLVATRCSLTSLIVLDARRALAEALSQASSATRPVVKASSTDGAWKQLP